MKITKRQLRRIIREATGQHEYRPWFRKPPKLPKDEWKIGDKVVANGYPGVIEDVGDDGMVEVRLKRGVVAVDGSTIVRQPESHIRESYYDHDYEEEYSQSEPPMGSFPHHWDQKQMDDWNQGFQDALHPSALAQVGVSDEYMDGHEEGVRHR